MPKSAIEQLYDEVISALSDQIDENVDTLWEGEEGQPILESVKRHAGTAVITAGGKRYRLILVPID